MAAIDKTYVNFKQYHLCKKFIELTKQQQLEQLGGVIYLYPEPKQSGVLWNTSTIQDVWLCKYCPLEFVHDRLAEQYEYKELKKLAELVDFSFKGIFIESITTNDDKIYIAFWKHFEDDIYEILEPEDEIIVYGTTHIFKVLNDIVKTIEFNREYAGKIHFNYYGASLCYENNEVFDPVTEHKFKIGYLNGDDFKFPSIKYSFDANESVGFEPYRIYISTETDVYPLTAFKDIDDYLEKLPTCIKSGRFGIPQYLTNLIKI